MLRIERKYLPSRKFILSLSVAVFLVLIAIALNYSGAGKETIKNNLVALQNNNSASGTWADALENASSSFDSLGADKKTIEAYKSLSPTDRLSRNFISNIVAYVPQGTSPDQNTTQYLVDKTFQDIPTKTFDGITKETDLNFSSDFSASAVELFKNNYFTETESLKKVLGSDITIINDSLSADKEVPQNKISAVTSAYQKTIDDMIKNHIPTVPASTLAKEYLALINDLEKLIKIDKDLVISNLNATDLYSDLNSYGQTITDLAGNMANIDKTYNIQR